MSRGGRRYGAGRPRQHRTTTSFRALDVRQLQREGLLSSGSSFNWTWRYESGEAIATIAILVSGTEAMLSYNRGTGSAACAMQVHVPLVKTACTYGGHRTWFNCPRCGRRVAIVYLSADPCCRQCLRLAYPVQSEDLVTRTWRRTRKIEAKLANGDEKWNGWTKPKGMRWATYARMTTELAQLLERRNEDLYARLVMVCPNLAHHAMRSA